MLVSIPINSQFSVNDIIYLKGNYFFDSFSFSSNRYFIVFNGVVTNSAIFSTRKFDSSFFINLYLEKGNVFFNEFKGSFCGIFIDIKKQIIVSFTNQTGDKKLFYAHINSDLIISDNVFDIINSKVGIKYNWQLNINSVYQQLSFGFILGDGSIIDNIYRIEPGSYILFSDKKLIKESYFKFSNIPNYSISLLEAIEEFDRLFNNAVQAALNKDIQYEKRHLCALSGGLDSRMTTYIAYKKQNNSLSTLTFGNSSSNDFKISGKIAKDFNLNRILWPVNDGNYLQLIDEIVYSTSGAHSYYGPAISYYSYKNIDLSKYGILHSGQLGDVIAGTFINSESKAYDKKIDLSGKALIPEFLNKVNFNLNSYNNNEMAYIYTRGLNGALCGNFTIHKYSESLSPFMDIDLMSFALSIPVQIRRYHKFYIKWILTKYKELSNYEWEKLNANISCRKIIFRDHILPVNKIPLLSAKVLFKFLGIKTLKNTNSSNYMVPFGFWFKNNELNTYFDNYFNDSIYNISDKELRLDLSKIYLTKDPVKMMQALTILSANNLTLKNR